MASGPTQVRNNVQSFRNKRVRESRELLHSNYKIEGNKKQLLFLLLVDLKVPVTEAGRKIMSWIKKTNGPKKYEESVGCSGGLAV